jgi:NAD(P)-dependent dehydrogenase (short-subunit alcohol dehydrogenase family)
VTLLQGKTALVTGRTTGIGLAAAQRIDAESAQAFRTGRNQSSIDAAVARSCTDLTEAALMAQTETNPEVCRRFPGTSTATHSR